MAQLISVQELALVLDEDISPARFDALYTIASRIVQSGFSGDLDLVTGRTADVVAGVLVSVMARIVANPKGMRVVAAGSASATFGGADAEITRIFSLNEDERAALDSVATSASAGRAFTIKPY